MYLLIIIIKKSEFMAAQRARPILLNERFLVTELASLAIIVRATFRNCTSFLNSEYNYFTGVLLTCNNTACGGIREPNAVAFSSKEVYIL